VERDPGLAGVEDDDVFGAAFAIAADRLDGAMRSDDGNSDGDADAGFVAE
jgi:hypothetical protein